MSEDALLRVSGKISESLHNDNLSAPATMRSGPGISSQLLDDLVNRTMPEVIRIRRQIHSHPELGFEERQTGALCAETLASLGVEPMTGIARTGVVGLLRGRGDGRTVALRADMDALPIPEDTGLEFSSRVPGLMHACGHDGHVAILLGTAMVLSKLRDTFEGSVKFIFQPAEESLGGAREMIAQGVLDSPPVDGIFALHLWPDLSHGQIGVHHGPAMAALDKVSITLRGRGGHVATPHKSSDAIVAASQLVLALQAIVSKETDPVEPMVLSIGDFKAGRAYNAIADLAELKGTVRTLDPALRSVMPGLIERKVKGIAESAGAEYDFEYTFGYPPVINDARMAEFVRDVCSSILGPDKVATMTKPSMVGEDFAYYLEKVPGAMFLIGTGKAPGESTYPLHHSLFGFDEDVLRIGVRGMVELVIDFLTRSWHSSG
ncbi:MAG: amidohydrolase [Firmicutes bacterium]|nr:amidohydrolase [Bacillota bacterium]